MGKIVQCVPNFSEGRRIEVIEEIAGAIKVCPGLNCSTILMTRATTAR